MFSFRRPTPVVSQTHLYVESLEARDVPSVTVKFDYSLDTNGFFNDPARRTTLEAAAAQIAPRLTDTLAPVAPGGSNTWQAQFFNPSTNSTVTLDNPVIGHDEILVYIGAAPLGGSELGLMTSGGFSASGSREWLDAVRGRGQAGATGGGTSDYATWGGMITFDDRVEWNFTTGQPSAKQYDFESVAIHELMHVFGFGLGQPAFTRNVVGGSFVGPAVVAANGGRGVPVVGEPADHFATGVNWRGQESPMQPSILPGVKRHLTPLDYAALSDIGWQVRAVPVTPPTPVAAAAESVSATLAFASSPLVASAAPALARPQFAVGTANTAVVYGQFGEVVRTVVPFGPAYTAGVRVASADLTGDGIVDLLAATGPGTANAVNIYDGATGSQVGFLRPFEAGFTGGLNIATGDVTGDGVSDVVVTPDLTGGPVVAVFDGAGLGRGQAVQINRFFGLDDPTFRGGLRPALGDLNGDGVADLALAAGFGGGPRVAVLDGSSLRGGQAPSKLVGDFFAFEQSLRNGVYVAIVDTNGDGRGELVAGAGPGGGPRVTQYDGASLLAGVLNPVSDDFRGDEANRTGVRVGSADINGDGLPELLSSVGGQVYATSPSAISSARAAGLPAPAPSLTVTAADIFANPGLVLFVG